MSRPRSSKQLYYAFRRDDQVPLESQAIAPPTTAAEVDRTKRRGYMREYVHWLRPFGWAVAGVCALALVAALLSLVLPRATMYIIDVILPAGDRRTLHMLGGGLLLLILFQQTFELLRHWRTAKLNARIVFRLRQKLYTHLLRLPLHELAGMKTGGITARLSGDIDSVTGMVQMAIITPGVAILKVTLTIAILLWISWKMAVAALLVLPIFVALNLMYIRRIRPIYRSMRRDRAEIDGRVVETFGGIRVVRAFSRERTEARRYAIRHHAVIRKHLLAQFLQHVVWSGWGFLIPLAALIIIWFGGTLYLRGEASIGGIVAFQLYLMMLLMPVSAIVKSYGEMQQALAALERIFDLLRRPMDKPDPPDAVPAPLQVETFEFDNVTFAYPNPTEAPSQANRPVPEVASRSGADRLPARKPVLQSFSLKVLRGTTVALVGPSGAGKTTVTNLVARFYDPDEGAVRLNGVDLRDIKLRSYRRLLGLVQQDVFLFDGTISENIAYGRPGATPAEVEDAARRANAHEFIMSFPHGYDTLVGERGVRLSGGQAQRISIARAILADPQILTLDEATSNLDSESEQLIQASLQALLADRTTFVIAHRLSTVVNADLIVVLEGGRIVESGTHEELMAASGLYRAMVQRQQRGITDTVEAADWLA
ncbi:MAG: ABC transporter ATP-binding protein [Phycisphaerae bacterium]